MLAVLLIVVIGTPQSDFLQYRDSDYPFSVWYPPTWKPVEASHDETRFKATSDGGWGDSDFSVWVNSVPELRETTPEAFAEMIEADPQRAMRGVRASLPGATLVESGTTELCNLRAPFLVYDGVHKALGLDVSMRHLQVSLLREGYLFMLTFRSPSERYEELFPLFQVIAAGFVVGPFASDAKSGLSAAPSGRVDLVTSDAPRNGALRHWSTLSAEEQDRFRDRLMAEFQGESPEEAFVRGAVVGAVKWGILLGVPLWLWSRRRSKRAARTEIARSDEGWPLPKDGTDPHS